MMAVAGVIHRRYKRKQYRLIWPSFTPAASAAGVNDQYTCKAPQPALLYHEAVRILQHWR